MIGWIRAGRAVAAAACAVGLAACAADRDDAPTVAVALGDSFISGEGAQDFITGDGAADYAGTAPTPLFALDNQTDPYFCHVSDNALIEVATLPGVDERLNLACSGAEPADLLRANPDFVEVAGGLATQNVPPQLDQYWRATAGKTVALVVVGLGANNAVNNFSGALGFCHAVFMADAAAGPAGRAAVNAVIEAYNAARNTVFPSVQDALDNNGCTATDFYSQAQLNGVRDAYRDGLQQLIAGMRLRGYPAGSWKLVLHGYGSPFAPTPDASFEREAGRTDDDNRFRALARERYAAGCPLHLETMRVADDLANTLSEIAQDTAALLRADFPDEDIVYLDVQRAFDGGRLCERANSPAGALFNPIWFRDAENNAIQRELPQVRTRPMAAQWADLAQACADADTGIFARCQDAAHPNASGHAALGRCLGQAVALSNRQGGPSDIRCRRDAQTGAISVAPF